MQKDIHVPFYKWNHKKANFNSRNVTSYKPKNRKITLEEKKIIQNHRLNILKIAFYAWDNFRLKNKL
jgi:hypothetical protein